MNFEPEKNLNPAQYQAVTVSSGPVLVIAGAGSGKTRTIIYRLAYLVDQGFDPSSILLLTFTRKSAQEMLTRASNLIGQGLHGVSGGTFHSFANSVLRRYASALRFPNDFTILDRGDSEEVIKQTKDLQIKDKKDRAFPKKTTLAAMISKSRNKEISLEVTLEKEASHLLPYLEDIQIIADNYKKFKYEHGLLDYDDLLFLLEELLLERQDLCDFLRLGCRHILVDEFQDTNRVQGRIIKHLSGPEGNLMAVGDDAQSIYSFRGATVSNILDFPQMFPKTQVIKLEQNYRSTQAILHLSNQILIGAKEKYEKRLFSKYKQGPKPQVLRPLSDQSQAQIVLEKVVELYQSISLSQIAVLFRAGYQSYPLEVALNKAGFAFQKYGGLKFTEAAHIKDVLAYLRLVLNPSDLPAWQRVMTLIPGIGPKTCERLYTCLFQENKEFLEKTIKKNQDLYEMLKVLDQLREISDQPSTLIERVMESYRPLFEQKYRDDFPKRRAGLEQLSQIASTYSDLRLFLTDMTLDPPEQLGSNKSQQDYLVLSTVHSAKGLEWDAVIILDLVEERFPSKHALFDADLMEEERRLFYVACTRAKEYLGLSLPESLYSRFANRTDPATPSPFMQEIDPQSYEEFRETYSGQISSSRFDRSSEQVDLPCNPSSSPRQEFGFCQHKIFGRGKVVSFVPPNKYKVNFPGFGLKVIQGEYIQMEI